MVAFVAFGFLEAGLEATGFLVAVAVGFFDVFLLVFAIYFIL
jgi:hypothetical protein